MVCESNKEVFLLEMKTNRYEYIEVLRSVAILIIVFGYILMYYNLPVRQVCT